MALHLNLGSDSGSLGSSHFNVDLNVDDPSSLLDAAFASVQNFQNEVFIMMSDIRDLDSKILKLQTKMEEEDSILQKHYYKQYKDGKDTIKPHNKESEINDNIEKYLSEIKKLTDKKLTLSTSLNYMITIKRDDLKNSMTKLSTSGQLSALDTVLEENRDEILNNFFNQKYKNVLNNKLLGSGDVDVDSDSSSQSDDTDSDREEELRRRRKTNNKKKTTISSSEISNGLLKSSQPTRHTRNDSSNIGSSGANGEEEDDQLYCFCQTVSFGEMVACDNNDCKYQWFHYGCIGLNEPPKGVWYCPDCRKKH
ncbi:hypothetical protein QEN19_001185 [Hanseniaspora menglaensis]